ncbi:ThuA domain-containing protein [Rufibacter aurantiacus]|uniref:ThuA domain-containing protein n=1 Tax=Rufibacter aurantiacus TaxID=2817374 RepID=UPI001B30E2D1|nr:ThuA domain-containing protein [Rufibacter aurantiacus]
MNKKNILIITSKTDPWHNYEEYASVLKDILQNLSYKVDIISDLKDIIIESWLISFDAVVFCGHHADRNDIIEQSIESFVHAGKGLVVVHIASSSFEFSPRWRKLVGRVWEYGGPPPFTSSHPEPPGSFRINITDRTHQITDGIEDFDVVHDERYQDLLVAPNAKIHDLAFATLEDRTEPMVWVLTPPEGGRVFHITLGHDLSTYKIEGFKELLTRGVAWVSGLLD